MRVLIAEDEFLIAMGLQMELEAMGAVIIGPANTFGEAMDAVAAGGLDVAILDVDLHGKATFDVADKLTEQGVPFMWYTGDIHRDIFRTHYGGVPLRQKPSRVDTVVAEMLAAG